MTKFLQTLLDGVSIGSLYALIALGYTMVYGVLQFINFAHGDVVMIGAWLALLLVQAFGWTQLDPAAGPFAAVAILLFTMTACALIGLTIERLAYRPMRGAPRLNVLITAIGVSLLIQNVGQLKFVFGTQPGQMPALVPDVEPLFTISGVGVFPLHLLFMVVAVGLMAGLDYLVHRTKLGLAMRAASHDVKTASLMGIHVDRVISLTFMIGSALAAAGGLLVVLKYRTVQQPAAPNWVLLGLKAFVAAVVGGIGNIRGAMLGGLLIGLLETFVKAYQSPSLADIYVFALLILVLLIRPTGLLGRPELQKV